jgi:nitrate/nitrite transport system substrate-binding protein
MTKTRLFAPTRRQFLGATATLAAARVLLPGGAFAAPAAPETTKATLGYIALTDSAPLVIAKEKGLFAKYGMPDVEIAKQASWGTTRDNLELGAASGGIDGAHILTPMPYLMALGKITKNNVPLPMTILARLNTNGQAISVSNAYKDLKVGKDASPLKEAFAKAAAGGKEIKCAMTFRGGTHDLWIRYWLAAGGIDPDKDVQTIVVPPPQMVANMKVGSMEAFCVGEPWNAQLVNQGIGFTALTTGELWTDHPEKSFAMRTDWVEKNPNATKALLMAVMEAQQWADKPENREELANIIGKRAWFNVPPADIIGRTSGTVDYGDGRKVENFPLLMKYWKDHASFPFESHETWFLTENIRWGILGAETDIKKTVAQVNGSKYWLDAAKELGVAAAALPTSGSRGKETFFDGKIFDPADPTAYLASLAIKRI